jgi:hypothetical protein
MDRFLLPLIFLRRGKRKLGEQVDLMTLGVGRYVDRTKLGPRTILLGCLEALSLARHPDKPNYGIPVHWDTP